MRGLRISLEILPIHNFVQYICNKAFKNLGKTYLSNINQSNTNFKKGQILTKLLQSPVTFIFKLAHSFQFELFQLTVLA